MSKKPARKYANRGRRGPAARTTRWHITKPNVLYKLNPYAKREQFRSVDFESADVRHDAKFVLPEPQPRKSDVPSVCMALNVNYFPDFLIDEWWANTLKKVDSKGLAFRDRYNIGRGDILHFLCICDYFGLVKLSSKTDYWTTKDLDILPSHPLCTARGMTYRKFNFIWMHFSAVDPASVDADDPHPELVPLEPELGSGTDDNDRHDDVNIQ